MATRKGEDVDAKQSFSLWFFPTFSVGCVIKIMKNCSESMLMRIVHLSKLFSNVDIIDSVQRRHIIERTVTHFANTQQVFEWFSCRGVVWYTPERIFKVGSI